jgi:hypothetical protein
MMLRAFGGGELMGDRLVRFAYLDESGIGDAKAEPFVVVAGVIVNADIQIKAIEKYLHEMTVDFVHPKLRSLLCFHAKELFNGGGIFDRKIYPKELRWKILRELCEIPQKFDLPVVMGFVPRAQYKAVPNRSVWKEKDLAAGAQAMASTACLIAIEKYMRQVDPNEVAALVYENNNDAKKLIKDTQRLLKDSNFTINLGPNIFSPSITAYLPLSRIVEAPLFSEKNESSLLQVSDAVAWAINRKLRNAAECDRFFEPIDKQLIIRAKSFGPAKVSAAVVPQT